MIQKNCFWYRPWKDMSVIFDQCELDEPTVCNCTENCKYFIDKKEVDELVLTIQMRTKT